MNVVAPTGPASPRAYFNLDWIALLVMFIVLVAGVVFFAAARGEASLGKHMLNDDAIAGGTDVPAGATDATTGSKNGYLTAFRKPSGKSRPGLTFP